MSWRCLLQLVYLVEWTLNSRLANVYWYSGYKCTENCKVVVKYGMQKLITFMCRSILGSTDNLLKKCHLFLKVPHSNSTFLQKSQLFKQNLERDESNLDGNKSNFYAS